MAHNNVIVIGPGAEAMRDFEFVLRIELQPETAPGVYSTLRTTMTEQEWQHVYDVINRASASVDQNLVTRIYNHTESP